MNSLRFLTSVLLLQVMLAPAGAAPLGDGASASWKRDFTLTDHMKVYDFPEQQVSYPVDLSAGIKADSLKLLALSGGNQAVPFQLSRDASGKQIICFRTDLPQGATRAFRLVSGEPGATATAAGAPSLQTTANAHEGVLSNSLLLVKVPVGHQDFAAGTPFSQAPAPILGLARKAQAWVAAASFSAPAALQVESMDAKMVESGPLFARYQIAYRLKGRKSYTATLELRTNEPYLRIGEAVSGFTPADQTFLQLNYGKGLLDPDRCLVAGNGGYFAGLRRTPYTGGYDEHASTNWKYVPWPSTQGWWDYDPTKDDSKDPQIGYCLGFYAPNAIAVMHATAFFPDKGSDALVLALNRLPEWKTYDRAVWTAVRLTENLRFYTRSQDGAKYMTAGLAGPARYWVVGLIPRAEIKIPVVPGAHVAATKPAAEAEAEVEGGEEEGEAPAADPAEVAERKLLAELGAGPEARLFNALNDWSIDAYKNRSADWPEKLSAEPFNHKEFFIEVHRTPTTRPAAPAKKAAAPTKKPAAKAPAPPKTAWDTWFAKPVAYEDYVKKLKPWVQQMAAHSSDFGIGGSVEFRGMTTRFGAYAANRAGWTPEQRAQARELLLFLADYAEGDGNEPHHSMMAGHPNFVMDVKCTLPAACAAFPDHPRAKTWRDSFMKFYNEWLDVYDRKDVPELNTKGGRWTENIACYLGQSVVGLEDAQKCLKAYDGTSLGQNPQIFALIRWVRDSMMSPHNGVRLVPPEGAHSAAFGAGGHFWQAFFRLCAELAPENPQLASEMRWMETNGNEGQKPDVRSALYTDYGPVFHYDFGGAHESYAHMQNINGLRYRWGKGGIVYYGAKGKAWSYNANETNGDKFDWNQVTAFNVGGKGMEATPTDQLLYDFGFAQFYRETAPAGAPYLGRGLMLMRDDYLVLADEVQDAQTAGTFNWVTFFDAPQIYQLKPAAPLQEKTTHDFVHASQRSVDAGHPEERYGRVFSYSGKGDFLTVVAPAAVKAVAAPFGATVNGEYVFASQKAEDISQDKAVFSGTYGYARPNQLALFQGTRIGLNGFELRREGGDFGVSASLEGNRIAGRIVGRSGGKVVVLPPAGLNAGSASVVINGKPVPHTVEQGAIVFSVEIAQRDGLKNYAIQFGQ